MGRQRGLSLVEMLVGVAVGLFIAAGASMLVAIQLSDNRRTLLELQLQQDLRASSDIVARELRREGFVSKAFLFISQLGSQPFSYNGYSLRLSVTPGNSSSVGYYYVRRDDTVGPFGFRLSSAGAIQSRLAVGVWQDLTDSNVVKVTRFSLTPRYGPTQKLACPKYCDLTLAGLPSGTTSDYCWPTMTVLLFDISITGQSVSDATVVRTVNTTVRVRNDWVIPNISTKYPDPNRLYIDTSRVCPN